MIRAAALLSCLAAGAGCGDNRAALDAPSRPLRVLYFQEEGADVGWYHASNPVAEQVFAAVGEERGWETYTAKQSSGVFIPEVLDTFDVVVYLVSSGTVLDANERAALAAFIAQGKGYVGVHSASFTDPDWQWYIDLVGSRFATESDKLYPADVVVESPSSLVSALPSRWHRTDQWYVFLTRPETNSNLEILLAVDETSLPPDYPGELKVGYHPIAWRQEFGGGRSFYTGMGHTVDSYAEPAFVGLVADAIEWAGAPSRDAAESRD